MLILLIVNSGAFAQASALVSYPAILYIACYFFLPWSAIPFVVYRRYTPLIRHGCTFSASYAFSCIPLSPGHKDMVPKFRRSLV